MSNSIDPILTEIEAFLEVTGMSASYFGKKATNNSELVSRLRDGRRVWPETAMKLRVFMAVHKDRKVRRKAA